ncbi:MAG: hypothetical protein COB37_03220 [Kordiimonadales bacterium]|nr:MAG: hypothetical protein COB37_03220 [Kordiimonadales bacterium]
MKQSIQRISRSVIIGAACLGVSFTAFADGHLAKAVSNDARPADEIARDAGRKPAAVLGYLGLETGMTVFEYGASGGYYTAIISDAVGEKGKVHAQIGERFWPRLKDTVGPRHKALGNVDTYVGAMGDFKGTDNSVDMMIISLIYHHLHFSEETGDVAPGFANDIYKSALRVLKPGAVFAIIEHQAPDGTARSASAANHRAALENAITDLTAAGFEYIGSSDLLANADDPQNIPFRDLASGRDTSQRFIAKFRKPA